ncbi:MAG: membrane integrity-associated transporter subunit PqiC [Yoonia sp.]|nr:membrane integrity-associated transporter subunit PqiC [Yoonia sp.]
MALPGCSAIARLNAAAEPRDTFDLRAVNLTQQGAVDRRNLLVADPSAAAALDTDRILIRPEPQTIAYLPDARWSDDLPRLFQTLLVQSLSSTGQIGFVGIPNAGPVPDVVLLSRIDRFDVEVDETVGFRAVFACTCTLLRDRDQRVIRTQRFAQSIAVSTDNPLTIARAFQALLDETLPEIVIWTTAGALS